MEASLREAIGPSIPCPGSILTDLQTSRGRDPQEPFFTEAFAYNIDEMLQTVEKTKEYDASDDVWTVIAHDPTIRGVVNFFPASANEWKTKGWEKETRWKFLNDFEQASRSKMGI